MTNRKSKKGRYGSAPNELIFRQKPLRREPDARRPVIHRARLYHRLALRICITEFAKGRVLGPFRQVRNLELEASPTALCLAYALGFDCRFEVNFFGDTLQVMLQDKTVVPESYWQYHSLEPFMVRLLALFRHESRDIPQDMGIGLGCYQAIVDTWEKPAALAKAISAACDFHCERIEDTSDEFVAEFRNPPFDLVPAEILAVHSVRQRLGLETPTVEHPLLEPPFSTPVGNPAEIHDELLTAVATKLGI